ncbi:MAG: hypothetical protein D6805_08805 [Planctomycetota bacterium]|nr:MAG: hypothetical protein D6805_08805 [Planctomycetota bacterium]
MPKNEAFWNPYRLIGPTEEVRRYEPQTHEKYQGFGGKIQGIARAITPIFVGGRDGNTFRTKVADTKVDAIPATSFKGMLRNLVEVVGKGCNVVAGDGVKNACKSDKQLCMACAMFGMAQRDENSKNVVFPGKVFFQDLVLRQKSGKTPSRGTLTIRPGAPQPKHEAFYSDRRRRKFYFHQPNIWTNAPFKEDSKLNRKIKYLPAGVEFDFALTFYNLTLEELGVLLYCLELEKGIEVKVECPDQSLKGKKTELTLSGDLHHKIGGARPYGLGSLALEFEAKREDFYRCQDRYRDFKTSGSITEEEWDRIRQEKEKYHLGGEYDSQLLKQLRAMLLYAEEDPRKFQYPDLDWFLKNKEVGLKEFLSSIRRLNREKST